MQSKKIEHAFSENNLSNYDAYIVNRAVYPTHMVSAIVRVLMGNGTSADELLANTRLTLSDVNNFDTRISIIQTLTLLKNALTLDQRPALGLIVGTQITDADRGVMSFAAQISDEFEPKAEIIEKYVYLSGMILDLYWKPMQNQYALELSAPIPMGECMIFLVELVYGYLAYWLKKSYQQNGVPSAINFSFRPPKHIDLYNEFFDCPINFDTEHNQFIADFEYLSTITEKSNQVTTDMLKKMFSTFAEKDDLVAQIRQMLVKSPELTLADIAGTLSQHSRTLSRRLEKTGSSFQSIKDGIRLNQAKHLLCNADLSIDQIATAVGFNGSRRFRAFFREQTGATPSEFRGE
jgi:AraC-like DNA-binding protein